MTHVRRRSWLLVVALLLGVPGTHHSAVAFDDQDPSARVVRKAPPSRPPLTVRPNLRWVSQSTPELPPWKEVEIFVAKYFARLRIPADGLVTQSQVKPLFADLLKAGWKVSDAKKLYESVPREDEFLVRQLRSAAGRKFEADVARFPNVYSRLDRLSRMPHGKATIEALVKGPDGYKMLQYMTTTRGGKNLGRQLSQAPTGKHFNDPTGRIYTPNQLFSALKQSYARDLQRQQGR